jgi:hypothetical protein
VTAQSGILQLFISGVWTDVSLFESPGSTITRGHDPNGSWPRPSKINCEINNDTLAYDPSRPQSALYGIVGRNTRARFLSNGYVRLWAEASAWVPDRTPEHSTGVRGRAWVGFTAEGILRRLSLWTEPLRSPMYRTIVGRASSVGHWSLEDDRDATALSNSKPGGKLGSIKGTPSPGETEAPNGAAMSIKLATGSVLSGAFLSASSTAGWQVSFAFRMPAMPVSATYTTVFRWSTGNGYIWTFDINNTAVKYTCTDADGVSLLAAPVLYGVGAEADKWVTYVIKASVSAGTVTLERIQYAEGSTSGYYGGSTFAGSVGALRAWWQDGGAVMNGAWFSHIYGVSGVADNLFTATALRVFNGYRGEAAGTRYLRLMGESGLTCFIIGTSTDTIPMGIQKPDTLVNLLSEIRETDGCRIDDERFDIALTMTTRRALYNQTPALTLSYPSQVAQPFTKLIDDSATHNVVTVKAADGGDITATLTTGAMSVQPPPAGVGESRQTVDVSVAAATQLLDIATHHLAKGTLNRPRYERVRVDLLANPGLAATAMTVREGNMIRITGFEPEPIDLLVVGFVETIGRSGRWDITYQVEPYDVWTIGVYDQADFRWDAATSTLAAGALIAATSFSLTCTDRNDVWSTSTPYDLMVAGERVTVTAMTAAAGTGPYTQTATVTRAVNGVSKAQLSGSEVHVFDYKRWGL